MDPKKIRLSPATFARTGMDHKLIQKLGEYGQNSPWLNADRGRILGPSRSQEIQEGDSVEIRVPVQ